METKICTVCKTEKDFSCYYNSKATKDGKGYRCKSCDDLARQGYEKRHKDKLLNNRRKAQRKYKYGLSDQQYNKLIEDQQGLCGICSVELVQQATIKHAPNTMCVDHSHHTGEVRGLLCTKCNKGLGLLGDSVEAIQRALDYLLRGNNADIH